MMLAEVIRDRKLLDALTKIESTPGDTAVLDALMNELERYDFGGAPGAQGTEG